MIHSAIAVINVIAAVLFLLLNGFILGSMLIRLRAYVMAKETVNPLLKRGIVLFGALAAIGAEAMALRALSVEFEPDSLEQLVFIAQFDFILIAALAYYALVEARER